MSSFCFLDAVGRPLLYDSKRSFYFFIFGNSLFLNHSPSEWFYITKKGRFESVLFYFFSRQSTITSKDSLPGIFPSLSAKQKSPLIGKVPMQEHFPPKLLLSADALYVVLHIPQVLFQFLFSYVSDPHIIMPILHPNRRKALTLFPAKWQHRLNPQNKCSRTEATAKGKKRIRKT